MSVYCAMFEKAKPCPTNERIDMIDHDILCNIFHLGMMGVLLERPPNVTSGTADRFEPRPHIQKPDTLPTKLSLHCKILQCAGQSAANLSFW